MIKVGTKIKPKLRFPGVRGITSGKVYEVVGVLEDGEEVMIFNDQGVLRPAPLHSPIYNWEILDDYQGADS